MLNPQEPFEFVASLFEDDPVYVNMKDADEIKIHKLGTTPLNEEDMGKHVTLVVIFTPGGGEFIFSGTSKGWINIFRTEDLKMVHSFKIANSNIKTLMILMNGRKLAVNSSDRIIRQINLPDLANENEEWEFEVEHKYQDVVNKLQWNTVSFNHNAEFLVASTFGQSLQDLYVWETSLGSLIKILEGSPEELIDVKWNYYRCMIGSTGLDSGTVYLWLIKFPQKWSALAPDFVEIEENIEYEEKEDEFDIIDEDLLIKKRLEEEDLSVDITTPETVDARGFDVTLTLIAIMSGTTTPRKRNLEDDLPSFDDPADLVNAVISTLQQPEDRTNVANNYANDKNHATEIQAYAKIAGQDWTFYVKSLAVSIGRNTDNPVLLIIQTLL
ncbi:hypothetical protein QCA50_012028 [Cerrena zonata]|uniref:Uncharacterized protein n=1 Tax=Cerrena zonata TaxID=2478898 RepID=A0AAW0G0Y7_9APHY